jgi:hypothetical protein
MFRQAVAREFERLVLEDASAVDLPEVEVEELQTSTKAVAFAQA